MALSLPHTELEISFTNETVTVSEGDGFFYLAIVKSGVTTSDITVNLNITDGSARGKTARCTEFSSLHMYIRKSQTIVAASDDHICERKC